MTYDGNGIGLFSSQINNLQLGTTYFVRAYATNEIGTAYGNTVSFKTIDKTINGYTLTQNETWSGTILLKGDIVVPSGITLTINPGTIINISTDAPLYDGGLSIDKIEFYIKGGGLIINGTAQNIVQLKSAASSPTNIDWDGIWMSGNRLDIAYCSISDTEWGIFNLSSTAMKISNCLFNNISVSAIFDLGSQQNSLSYNSFINVGTGYYLCNSNRIAQLDYSEFRNNYWDLKIAGSSDYITNNSSISVNYSNFSGNKLFNLYWDKDVTNSNITANYCYGITTYPANGNGNTYSSKNPLSSPYSGAGCGFSSNVKSASLRSYIIDNPEQRKRIVIEHDEKIKRIYDELNRQGIK